MPLAGVSIGTITLCADAKPTVSTLVKLDAPGHHGFIFILDTVPLEEGRRFKHGDMYLIVVQDEAGGWVGKQYLGVVDNV